jgi:hypothetical protein
MTERICGHFMFLRTAAPGNALLREARTKSAEAANRIHMLMLSALLQRVTRTAVSGHTPDTSSLTPHTELTESQGANKRKVFPVLN